MIFKNRHNIFWLVLLASTFFLYVQMIVQQGIFFDGLVYSTLANNLSLGIGTTFNPKISDYFFNNFHEHPFLGIYLESLFFKVLGHAYYVERLYTFTLFSLVTFLLYKFWGAIYKKSEDEFVWLPILFFLPLPLIFWSFTQNMLETTMTLFSLFAVYALYLGVQSKRFSVTLIYLLLAALSTIAAFFAKGPVGIFPLATLFLYYLFFTEFPLKRALLGNLIFLLSVTLFLFLFFQNEQLLHATQDYLNQQVFAALQGHRNTVDNRFVFLIEIVKETLPLTIITTLLYLLLRKKVKHTKEHLKQGAFFIAIGLSASVPIMLSTKQFGFYLVPSIPYFSLGFAILALPYVKYLVNKINQTKYPILFFSLILLASLAFTYSKVGEYSRDENRLKDLQAIAAVVEQNSTISGESAMNEDASLNSYLMRNYTIALDATGEEQHNYYLFYKKSSVNSKVLKEYKKTTLKLHLYYLYKKREFRESE